ncbi:MAG: histone deacetylase family protein [Akkermansiaceae bacterium]
MMKNGLLRWFSIGAFSFANLSCSFGGAAENEADELSPIPIVYSPNYKISVFGMEKLHPFDIAKYDKIYDGLKKDGYVTKKSVIDPAEVTREQMLLIHTEDYLESLKKTANVAGYLEAPQLKIVPNHLLDKMIVSRFRRAAGGTIEAARQALKSPSKMAINLGGGFHHAKPETGEGFCIIADVPIAIRVLQKEKLIKRALIIDTDIHQGNGTIVSLKDDLSTYTFSMHEGGIYPMPKEVGDEDVELDGGVTDAIYLKVLAGKLDALFVKSSPDMVFHVAGCDALDGDPLASGLMTHEGIQKRDEMIVAACKKHGVPYVMTLSGGYSKDAWNAQYKSIKALIEGEQ